MHTHINGSDFTPVDYYCISTTLNYIYSLVSCQVATCFLFFPGGSQHGLKRRLQLRVSVEENWRLATLCMAMSNSLLLCTSVSPLIPAGRVIIPKAILSALLELLVPLLLNTWLKSGGYSRWLCVIATAACETPFSAPADCETELQRTLVQVPVSPWNHHGPVFTGVFAGQTHRLKRLHHLQNDR